MSLYEDLGVPEHASREEIKRAHRALVKKFHPDNAETRDREKFEKAQRAGKILSDPDARARYDETGESEAKPDNRLAELAQLIVAAFQSVAAQVPTERLGRIDLVAQTRKAIEADCAAQRANIRQAKVDRKRFERMQERLARKGGANFLAHAVMAEIAAIDQAVAAMDASVLRGTDALALLAEFSYRVDPEPAPGSFAQMVASTSTAGLFDGGFLKGLGQ